MAIVLQRSNESVLHWLRDEFQKRHIAARVHEHLVRQEEGWLYVPVYLPDVFGTSQKATLLQQVESVWNDRNSDQGWHLLLIPAAD